MKSLFIKVKRPKNVLLIALILLLAWGAYRAWLAPKSNSYDLATATRGTIVEQVSVTGNTTPVTSLDLAFENGGTIAAVNYDVRAHVDAGNVIVRLNTSDLEAQLAQANANIDAQAAKLKSLQAGSRPEDIQASQAALAKAQQDLSNMYANVSTALTDGYNKTNDAVRNQLASFFSGPETNNPQLTFSIADSQILNDVQAKRIQVSFELNAWQSELGKITPSSPTSSLEAALQQGMAHLQMIQDFLTVTAQAVTQSTNLSATSVSTYKTAVTTGLGETNAAAASVSGSAQGIASQKITVSQLQAQLNLKIAGSTAEDIAAQQAAVEQAQASAASIQVKIAKASLISPISGIITVQNAKAGQIATPGAVMVSLISDQGLEIDANIAEADIGKISTGNAATMNLDAFPDKTFEGRVSHIDPGETVLEGVPTYKTTFQFDNLGPEVKPGMTANIDITADRHENVIYVPQRAVSSSNGRRTVKVYHGGNVPLEERTVMVGLRDTNGNIEIVSGLSEGEQVLRSND